jgi:glucose-1-phosphate cytidylyltransferase
VTLIDTGERTMTGGRLKRAREHIGNETFCLTYGDGVSDVDISEVIRFHKEQKVLATLTAAQPPGRFGALTLGSEQTYVHEFREKPGGDGAWVNGGFFVLEPGAIDYVADDSTVWEREPMERLARDGNLAAYKHRGFWHPMDSLRDKVFLEDLWNSGNPPWKVW